MKTNPEEKNTFENNPKSKLTNGKIATDHDSDDSSV